MQHLCNMFLSWASHQPGSGNVNFMESSEYGKWHENGIFLPFQKHGWKNHWNHWPFWKMRRNAPPSWSWIDLYSQIMHPFQPADVKFLWNLHLAPLGEKPQQPTEKWIGHWMSNQRGPTVHPKSHPLVDFTTLIHSTYIILSVVLLNFHICRQKPSRWFEDIALPSLKHCPNLFCRHGLDAWRVSDWTGLDHASSLKNLPFRHTWHPRAHLTQNCCICGS